MCLSVWSLALRGTTFDQSRPRFVLTFGSESARWCPWLPQQRTILKFCRATSRCSCIRTTANGLVGLCRRNETAKYPKNPSRAHQNTCTRAHGTLGAVFIRAGIVCYSRHVQDYSTNLKSEARSGVHGFGFLQEPNGKARHEGCPGPVRSSARNIRPLPSFCQSMFKGTAGHQQTLGSQNWWRRNPKTT